MIRVNLLRDEADVLFAAFYRWWTVKAWKWGVKLGPVTFQAYRWFDGRIRVGLCTHWHRNERIIWGGPLA